MSSYKEFSAEELQKLSLWELPSIKNTDAGDPRKVPNAVPTLPTVEQIEAMQKLAFEEAAKQGRQEGYEKGFEQGKSEGFEIGHKDGLEQGQVEIDKKIRELGKLLDLLSEPLKELDAQVEEELLSLAVAIARQLVRRELKTESDQIIAVIREAVQALPTQTRKVQISLHPKDAELVRSTLRLEEAKPRWELLEDPLISQGGCRVETENSRIDSTVENRLNRVIAAVLGGERKTDFE